MQNDLRIEARKKKKINMNRI